MIEIGRDCHLDLHQFWQVIFAEGNVYVSEASQKRLDESRQFIDHLLDRNIKVYGLTTGFADLRNIAVSPKETHQLSINLIRSHDAGIGEPIDRDVVLGAMLLRAHSLAKGNSGFTKEGLQTLIGMINARIVPVVPCTGSLGASGDLAFLARLGRAMMGDPVLVYYRDVQVQADEALRREGIARFQPKAKEGLALTNGTSFMASMMAIAFLKEVHILENIFSMFGLFFNAAQVVDGAFVASIQQARGQEQQANVAAILRQHFVGSPFIDHVGVQNDYCIRCLPQIFGAKLEMILAQKSLIIKEMNAITDNPLIFKNDEIGPDVTEDRIIWYQGDRYAVLSGGNFHGEYSATSADVIAAANAKIALTLERQMAYILNPARNERKLPVYLIANREKAGLYSGFMITQYTANALAQKICHLGIPVSIFNITSGNECEDVVSYGASSAEKLLKQLDLLQQLTEIYFTTMLQAYSLVRKEGCQELICEKIFLEALKQVEFPILEDVSFVEIYAKLGRLLSTNKLREQIGFPFSKSNEGIFRSELEGVNA